MNFLDERRAYVLGKRVGTGTGTCELEVPYVSGTETKHESIHP
jgi:hypothetical protein